MKKILLFTLGNERGNTFEMMLANILFFGLILTIVAVTYPDIRKTSSPFESYSEMEKVAGKHGSIAPAAGEANNQEVKGLKIVADDQGGFTVGEERGWGTYVIYFMFAILMLAFVLWAVSIVQLNNDSVKDALVTGLIALGIFVFIFAVIAIPLFSKRQLSFSEIGNVQVKWGIPYIRERNTSYEKEEVPAIASGVPRKKYFGLKKTTGEDSVLIVLKDDKGDMTAYVMETDDVASARRLAAMIRVRVFGKESNEAASVN